MCYFYFKFDDANKIPLWVQWNRDTVKERENLFALTRFRYIEVLFHIFYYYRYWGKKSFVIPRASLYRGSFYQGSTVYPEVA